MDEILRHLKKYGAEAAFSPRIECRLACGGEEVCGYGATEKEALTAALKAMLPTHLAQLVFADSMTPTEPSPEAPAPEKTTNPAPPQPPPPADEVPVPVAPSADEVPTDSHRTHDDFMHAIDVLDGLAESLAADDILPMDAPARIQAKILHWIGVIRHIQETVGDPGVQTRIDGLMATLGRLSHDLWPGSISALQRSATPASAAKPFGGPHCRSWQELADHAAQILARDPHGDDGGWRDATACASPPDDPPAVLRAACESLAPYADLSREGTPPPPKEMKALHAAAIRLRWVRPWTDDPRAWGHAMGTLRRVHQTCGDTTLGTYLDPAWSHAYGWGHLAGRERVSERRTDERRALSAARPAAHATPAEVAAWFTRCFGVFAAGECAALARRIGPPAETLAEEVFGTRDGRKHWRRVRASLDAPPTDDLPPEVSGDTDAPEEPPPLPATHPAQDTTDDARALVAGRRAIVLSNRDDAALKDAYEEKLGLTVVSWVDSNHPGLLTGARNKILNHGTDMVIAIVGFLPHAVEHPIRHACTQAQIPYIRVGKGRPAATARSLVRVYGKP